MYVDSGRTSRAALERLPPATEPRKAGGSSLQFSFPARPPSPFPDQWTLAASPVSRAATPFALRCSVGPHQWPPRACRGPVDAGWTMADPLPPTVHWHTSVKLDITHFEGCRMSMPHQVADQPAIFVYSLRPFSVGHPCRLHNRFVRPHVVDDTYEPVIQNLKRNTQDLIQTFHLHSVNFPRFACHELLIPPRLLWLHQRQRHDWVMPSSPSSLSEQYRRQGRLPSRQEHPKREQAVFQSKAV